MLRTANRTRAARVAKDLQIVRDSEKAALTRLRETRKTTGRRQAGQPISLFILGPSRSGKTSLEMLFATLEGVKRGYENPGVDNATTRTFQDGGFLTSWLVDHLPPQFHPKWRENYLEELGRRAGSARVFTNTHPQHIQNAARMATLLPDVRFMFVKRNVEDLMLRIYMRNYRRGNAYAYSLESIHDHVNWYHEMMDLMVEKFPDIVRIVR